MENRNRREFLVQAGITVSGLAIAPRLVADMHPAPDSSTFESSSANSDFSETAFLREPGSQSTAVRKTMRGLMVDAGRVPESMDYYRRVIEFCADWQLNTLQFRLADDQGTALRFSSVPHLVTHETAFKPEELKDLAEYAQRHGIDLIPELESFGHTGYITRSPAYAHLLDSESQGPSDFTGVIPVSPETLHLFDKLYGEVAAIFPSAYLHGGCDEVNWGGSMLSRKSLQAKTRAQIWAAYLNSLDQMSQGFGKTFIVWGDFVLHKEPEILGQLNKGIVIMDWNYRDNNSVRLHNAFEKVVANGSRGIGAPALVNYKWGPRVGTEQLRNIDAFADSYLAANDPNSLGVILTNWIPSRYIQNSIWDGLAYAAVAFNQGTATAQTSGFRRFVEKHYGAPWNEIWDEVFQLIYDDAPCVEGLDTASWMALQLPIPWSDDEQLAATMRSGPPRSNPFTRLRSLLVQLEPLVLKNLSDFQAFELSVEYLENIFWREAIVIEEAARVPLQRATTDTLIQNIAERDQELAEALSRDWDKGRSPKSAARLTPVFGLEAKDQLLFQWERASSYSASLAGHPDRFYRLVKKAHLGERPTQHCIQSAYER